MCFVVGSLALYSHNLPCCTSGATYVPYIARTLFRTLEKMLEAFITVINYWPFMSSYALFCHTYMFCVRGDKAESGVHIRRSSDLRAF